MRRDELSALGIQLPLLPTLVRGGLPGGAGWGDRLATIGVDVMASGATDDSVATWEEARSAAVHRPCRAVTSGDPSELVGAGCRMIEAREAPPEGVYHVGLDEAGVTIVTDAPDVEDPNRVARAVVDAARDGDPSRLWVIAGPGLDALAADLVEAKLRSLVESAVQARMVLAKEQFDIGRGERPESGGTGPSGG